jgi:hypothetical protein
LVVASRKANRRAVVARRRVVLPKDTTRGHCGPRKGLVAARRGTTRRVEVARRNILSRKDTTREHRESRKKLAATSRKETRRAKVTRHKGNFVGRHRRVEIATGGNHTWDRIDQGTRRLRELRKRRTADVLHGIPRDT